MLLPLITVALAGFTFAADDAAAQSGNDRPNIIVFVSDDHRADVLGCAGHPIVQTPNIDRLAEHGTRFSNAFVTTSICAASRATILTGLVERTHGFTFGTPPLSDQFALLSYPAVLRDNGYRTGFVGKFGISVQGGRDTINEMFDSYMPLTRTPYLKQLEDGTTRHVTDITGDKAIEFIRSVPANRPFCLSVSFNAGHAEDNDKENHYPYPESEAELYADTPMPRPRLDDPAIFKSQPQFLKDSLNRQRWFWRWDTPEKYDHNLRNYFRMLTGLDRNIGRVLDELAERGIAGNTVIIFIGDNGYYMGERGFAGKWSHYDESLRVPLVIYDPRVAEELGGRVDEDFALNTDIAPTVLDLAGIAFERFTQGVSLEQQLHGDQISTRSSFYCEHRMEHEAIPRWEGIRTAEHMYARYLDVQEGNEFVYDLQRDPDERHNLAGDTGHAELLKRKRAETGHESEQYAAAGSPLPRVLMLGDSISMGYHQSVIEALIGQAVIMRPAENCAGTTKGTSKIAAWLRLHGGGYDLIHFNFGLHDLKRVKEDGSNSNDPNDGRQAELDAYEANLRTIVDALEATGATLIFATTTPVPPGGVRPHRDPEDVERYNEVAKRIMDERGIAVNDLYAFSMPRLDEIQQPVNVHFSREGSRQLGDHVADQIRAAIHSRGR